MTVCDGVSSGVTLCDGVSSGVTVCDGVSSGEIADIPRLRPRFRSRLSAAGCRHTTPPCDAVRVGGGATLLWLRWVGLQACDAVMVGGAAGGKTAMINRRWAYGGHFVYII